MWPGGAVFFTGKIGQEFQMISYSPVFLEGRKNRPLMSDGQDEPGPYLLEGSEPVTDHGVLMLEGPYRARLCSLIIL